MTQLFNAKSNVDVLMCMVTVAGRDGYRFLHVIHFAVL